MLTITFYLYFCFVLHTLVSLFGPTEKRCRVKVATYLSITFITPLQRVENRALRVQDNDRSQYDFVSALHRTANGSVFLVGDLDQAIYQFRGADVRLFVVILQAPPHRLCNGFSFVCIRTEISGCMTYCLLIS